jgi:hypothetical protein
VHIVSTKDIGKEWGITLFIGGLGRGSIIVDGVESVI